MWKFKAISTLSFLVCLLRGPSSEGMHYPSNMGLLSCKKIKDTLTKEVVYVTVDTEAKNEGGPSALVREYNNISLGSMPHNYDTKFVIAFIVKADGQIIGERILKDNAGGSVGAQMIKIVKSLKWIPAECNKRKVASLVKVPLQICLNDD
jgi:hypothetical protein